MKKILFILCMVASATALYSQTYYVAGDFQGWKADSTLMYDNGTNGDAVSGDGIYSRTLVVATTGSHGWKVTNGTFATTWPANDSWFATTTANQVVLFTFNTNTVNDIFLPNKNIVCTNETKPTSIVAIGDWQSKAGETGNWMNGSTITVMHDDGLDGDFKAGDGIYTIHISTLPAGTWSGRPVKSGDWPGWGTDGRSQNPSNMSFTTTSANQHVYMYLNINTGRIGITYNTPLAPNLTTLKSAITFGSVAKNSTKMDTISIRNSSSIQLTIDSIYTKTAVFAVNKVSATVGADTLKIVVSFTPTAIASFTDTVYLRNNSSTPLVKVALSGNSPAPGLLVRASSFAFGSKVKGDSATSTCYLVNTSISAITIGTLATASSVFKATATSMTVKGLDSTLMTVKFKPTAFGSFTDTVTIVSDGGTTKIPVSGASPAPVLTNSKSAIAYNFVAINSTKKDSLLITNSSMNTLVIDSIYTKTMAFTVSRTNASVSADTAKVVLAFTPTAAATYVDTLYLRNNSASTLVKIPLSGSSIVTYYLAGDFQSWSNNTTLMYDDGTNGDVVAKDSIYTRSYIVAATGFHGWKVTNGTWDLTWPAKDGWFTTTTANQSVTFTINTKKMNDGWLPNTNIVFSTDVKPTNLVAVGDWQSKVGETGDWVNNSTKTAMHDDGLDGDFKANDGIFAYHISTLPVGTYQIKSVQSASWNGWGTDGRSQDASNLSITTTSANQHVYFYTNVNTGRIAATLNAPLQPSLTALKTQFAFGNVVKNTTKKDTIRIINVSAYPLTIDSIYTKNSAFAVDKKNAVVGSDTLKIVVTFAPNAFASFADTVYLSNNSATKLVKIALTGNSPIPVAVLSAGSLTFGIVKKDSSISKTVIVTNTSVNGLVIDSLYTRTKNYTITSITLPKTVTSDSAKLTVVFRPDSVKSYNDTLFIRTNSANGIIKIPLSGSGALVGVNVSPSGIPDTYELSQNFPNPFNPSTTIRYALPTRSNVRLQVFNILGQMIDELVNREQEAGYQTVLWNARVTSGVYLFRIEAVDTEKPEHRMVETRKMSLIR